MSYSLRLATIEDIPELIEERIAFVTEAYNEGTEDELNAYREVLRGFFKTNMEEDTFVAWLAVDENDQIIATSGLLISNLIPTVKDHIGKRSFIFNMYTRPAWRRKGISSALLEKLLEESKTRGIYSIDLYATDLGKSIYEKFGFKTTDSYMALRLK